MIKQSHTVQDPQNDTVPVFINPVCCRGVFKDEGRGTPCPY